MNDTIIKECKTHGSTDFRLSKDRPNGRCKKCSVDAVTKRRKLIKVKAVEYKGGVCEHCDNVYIPEVFEFHHKEPTEKDFAISANGNTKSWDDIKTEIDKCLLLCANCHRIEHVRLKNNT